MIEISPSLIESGYTPSKIKEYKKEVEDARKSYLKTIDEVEEGLAKSYNYESESSKKSKKESLIAAEEDEAYRQYNKLEASKRKILEVEKRGTDIQRDLHQQTETMIKVNSNIGSMNIELNDSNSLVKKMLRREAKNKLLICSVFVVVVIIFLLILFVKLSGSSNSGLKQNLSNGEPTEEVILAEDSSH